jgi:hypothetical protein
MTIDIVTVYTPRPSHEKFMDFLPLIRLQKATAEKFGYRHLVVSDQEIKGCNVVQTQMPATLMLAIMAGQVAYLRDHWDGERCVVLLDCDCLIARPLDDVFRLPFDLGLTNREDLKSPINNGAMYISGNKPKVLEFFERAQSLTAKHWGGDQEAISKAAAPVPKDHRIECRDGLRIAFLSMRAYNCIPRERGVKHKKNPYVVHFKGEERKPWMETYARSFIL